MTKMIRAGTPEAVEAIAVLKASCWMARTETERNSSSTKVEQKPVLTAFRQSLRDQLRANDSPLRCRCLRYRRNHSDENS